MLKPQWNNGASNIVLLLAVTLLYVAILVPTTAVAESTTLYQSVEQALSYSPQFQALAHSQQAVGYDLKQAGAKHLPSVDLQLGYGLEQHSDDITRRDGADPDDTDWDPRGEVSLKITQNIYKGGETVSEISIQKALLDVADYQLRAAGQAISLNAVMAHVNVLRQRELVSLAEKNVKSHRNIHQLLVERESTGAGSIVDVTQSQARLSQADSTLHMSQANLSQAKANYIRVIGRPAQDLAYAGVPSRLPQTLEEAIQQSEMNNPDLLIFDAEMKEAESRLALARSKYKPKIDLELSSRYTDQLEGNGSWEYNNAAMVNLSWNLFNGGQDKAGHNAALSRVSQSRARKTDKRSELIEAMTTVWSNHYAFKQQKTSYLNAMNYSWKTLDAYMKQFTVSKRSLIDLLIAENDYFHSAVQLINATFNETITAYQILELTSNLQIDEASIIDETPEFINRLEQTLSFNSAVQPSSSIPLSDISTSALGAEFKLRVQ